MDIGNTCEASWDHTTCALAGIRCVRVQREIIQEIADDNGAEAVVYERHTNDLAKLKKAYEQHAKECAQTPELTVDPRRREVYLRLARDWTEAAALRA